MNYLMLVSGYFSEDSSLRILYLETENNSKAIISVMFGSLIYVSSF